MSRPTRRKALTSLALASVFIGSLAASTSAAPATTPAALGPCVAGWQEMPVPTSAFESTPFEIVTRNGKSAWIVGGTNSGPLVLRSKSGSWKHVAKSVSGHRGYVGAVPTGASKLLAVGYERVPDLEYEPYVGRLNGDRLSRRNPPRPVNDRAGLADVVGLPGGKAWAVGTRLYRGKLLTFASRWTGSRWKNQHPPSGSGGGLLAIDRAPNGTLWAVGWKEATPGRPKPLIARYAKGKWKTTRGPALGTGTAILTDVSFQRNDAGFAVGYQVKPDSDRHRAILFRWDGKRWTRAGLPWADDFSAIPRSISTGPGQIWIGGAQLATEGRETRGFVASLADGTWDVDVLGVPKDVRSEVTDVAVTNKGAIATAAVAGSALVLRACEAPKPAAAKKSRIRIGAIDDRRDTDELHLEADVPASADTFSLAAALPAPVPASGFVIRDRTNKAGLNMTAGTYDGFAADIDGNGWKDVFIGRHGGQLPVLMMNSKSAFKRAAGAPLFSVVDRHACDSADVDRSGSRDIFCVVGRARGKQITRHELTLDPGTAGGRLDRASAGLADPLGRGRAVEFVQLDKDGWPDVFIGSAPDRDDSLPSLNRFYRNVNGTYRPAPEVGLDKAHGAICSWSGDIDNDSDEDLAYCTFWRIGKRAAGVRLMRNEGGKLVDRTIARGIRPIGDIDVTFADVTGDGRKDIIQLSQRRLRVSKWTKSGYVKTYEVAIFDGMAIAAGDVNRDGRADIYIARGSKKANRPDRLLVSRDNGRRFTSVRIPTTTRGAPDDVFSLDYDKNGYDDFVVLNGGGKKGPVKLLASFPG